MKTLIFFSESTDVKMHTADLEALPRQGDHLWLPDISARHTYPVERVTFNLIRRTSQATLEQPSDGPTVKIYLGEPLEDEG
jgi:hypothetical protein